MLRPVAPGDGMVRADEDAAPGAELAPAGRPLRAQDLGMLAAAGVTELSVHARPRVTIVSTGDELVRPDTADLDIGQVRDSTAVALAALVDEAGGDPRHAGIVPDDREATGRDAPRRARRQRCARGVGGLVGGRARRDGRGDRLAGRAGDLVPRTRVPPGQADTARRLRRGSGDRIAGEPTVGARGLPRRRGAHRAPRGRLHGAAARAHRARPARPRPPVGGGPGRCRASPRTRGCGDTALRIVVAALDPHRRGRATCWSRRPRPGCRPAARWK